MGPGELAVMYDKERSEQRRPLNSSPSGLLLLSPWFGGSVWRKGQALGGSVVTEVGGACRSGRGCQASCS